MMKSASTDFQDNRASDSDKIRHIKIILGFREFSRSFLYIPREMEKLMYVLSEKSACFTV